MKEALDIAKTLTIKGTQHVSNNNFSYSLFADDNKSVEEFAAKFEFGLYSKPNNKTFPVNSDFFSLSYQEMLEQLPNYLSIHHPLYEKINYLLSRICKLSQ